MALVKVDTAEIEKTAMDFRNSIRCFENYRLQMEFVGSRLMDTWRGIGRNQFETQYTILKRQLKDISEELYDIYDSLLEAENFYVKNDNEYAKALKS